MVINKITPYKRNNADRLAITIKDGNNKFVAHMTVAQWNNWTRPVGSSKGTPGMSYEDAKGLPCDIDFKMIGEELQNGTKVTSEDSIVDDFTIYTGEKALDYQATVAAKVTVATKFQPKFALGGKKADAGADTPPVVNPAFMTTFSEEFGRISDIADDTADGFWATLRANVKAEAGKPENAAHAAWLSDFDLKIKEETGATV